MTACCSPVCGREYKINAYGVRRVKRDDLCGMYIWQFYVYVYTDSTPVQRVSKCWIGEKADVETNPVYVACAAGQKSYTFPFCRSCVIVPIE